MGVSGDSSVALNAYMGALSGGRLASMDADEAYGLMDTVASDPAGLAVSLGFDPQEGVVLGRGVVSPLLDKYLSAVARDDGGMFALSTDAAARDADARLADVSASLGVPAESVGSAVSGLAEGDPVMFDRMMADYYS